MSEVTFLRAKIKFFVISGVTCLTGVIRPGCQHWLQSLSLLACGGSYLTNSLRQDLKAMDIRSFF